MKASKISISIYLILSIFESPSFSQTFSVKSELFPGIIPPVTYPAISPDGKKLVFLSDDGESRQAYISEISGTRWSDPRPMERINSILNMPAKPIAGGFSFNYDGTVLYFHSNLNGNYDIGMIQYRNGEWQIPQYLPPPINSALNEYSPAFSTNGNMVILLRDKAAQDKNKSCKELVMYEKDKNGVWTGPQYLPSVFNSGCQETPFLCADNRTLFFASERPDTNNLGKKTEDLGFNLYYTKRLYGNGWYIPAYMDELNTEFHDLSPSLTFTGSGFYMNIKADKLKNEPQGIFAADLPQNYRPDKLLILTGKITDLENKKPLEALITVSDAITSVIQGEYNTLSDGSYSLILNSGSDYKIDFFKEGYSHVYLFRNTLKLSENQTEKFDLSLYNEVNLDLNVFDNELFYPLSPQISITDSLNSNNTIPVKEISRGRYSARLRIGSVYKLSFEAEFFDPLTSYFDLQTDVQYNSFERDFELQASKRKIILDITDATTKEKLEADISVTNLSRDEASTLIPRVDAGKNLYFALRFGDEYALDVAKKGYTYFNTQLKITKDSPGIIEIPLTPLSSETKLVFNNITFETNSAELNSNSFDELNRLARFIKENPEFMVEISAHTDDIGSDAYNNNLSDKRAKKVVEYLVKQSVNIEVLQYKGYGKSKPLVPNTSDGNRALNRRVELNILEKSPESQ